MKPILFNSEMVKAVLDGRKTQTRRVMKSQPTIDKVRWNGERWEMHMGYPHGHDVPLSPYGKVDGLLWVRETWATTEVWDNAKPSDMPKHLPIWYVDENFGEYKKRPSIFMPRWASRITLKIIDIKIEPLQDITETDAAAEGVSPSGVGRDLDHLKFRAGFVTLWDLINAKRGYDWDSNPWVWVVEFEKVSRE